MQLFSAFRKSNPNIQFIRKVNLKMKIQEIHLHGQLIINLIKVMNAIFKHQHKINAIRQTFKKNSGKKLI